jgi:acetate kinase
MNGLSDGQYLLTVNVGSSSVRLAAYDSGRTRVADLHESTPAQQPEAQQPVALQPLAPRAGDEHVEAEQATLRRFVQRTPGRIGAVVHRVVHGGDRFQRPCRLNAAAEQEIAALAELAPLHNGPALRWIAAARGLFGAATPQLAVFDTAFYVQLPEVARRYGLPHALSESLHLRRYGFHGLAHRYLWQRWQSDRSEHASGGPRGRVISLQLGSGCSITAIRGGVPVDTSMGFSPLEGLLMATRCGDIDPGLLLYVQRKQGLTAEQLEHLLSHDSGLKGVSGVSGDARELLARAASGDARAALAVDLFCYRARKYVGAYLAVLGGADAILFGGGIGEHLPSVRARILDDLRWAGIDLDPARNAATLGCEGCIDAGGDVEIRVIPVDESAIMAEDALELLAKEQA